MRQNQRALAVHTAGRGLYDLTSQVSEIVAAAGVRTGQCTIFCQHTSCSLVIHERASSDAADDLLAWLERLAPDGDPRYSHDAEGPDDMPAHLRSVITRTSETIPVAGGRLALGRWQGLFLLEHRRAGSERRLLVHVLRE